MTSLDYDCAVGLLTHRAKVQQSLACNRQFRAAGQETRRAIHESSAAILAEAPSAAEVQP